MTPAEADQELHEAFETFMRRAEQWRAVCHATSNDCSQRVAHFAKMYEEHSALAAYRLMLAHDGGRIH